ncbi:hypothetical protein TWF970_000502 [Orbilia oligospora]|uniref:Uncharacterized protein n=1 Tax=Orbilia oligospora TaxID=2813651 RepID=A0A7C8RKB5_ORBOL|nr:hypothetical protein TWF970_000502 [Orbilia oligospora]
MSNSTAMPPASLSAATGAPTMEGVRDIIFEGWTHGSSFEDVVEVIDFTYMGTEGGGEVLVEVLRDLKNLASWAEKLGKRAIKMRKAVAVEEKKDEEEKEKEKEEEEEEEEDNDADDEGEEGVPKAKGKGRKRRNLKEEAKKRKEKKKEKRAKEVKAQGGKGGGGGAKGPEKEEEEKAVVVATPEGGPMVFDDPMDIDPVEPDIVEPLVGGVRRLVVDVWSVHLPPDIVGALVRDSPYQREGAEGQQRSYRRWRLERAVEGKRRRRKARKAKRGSP